MGRLGPSAEAWDRLVASQPVPSPFARSWWLEAMAAALPRRVRPCQLLVHDGDRLIGGVALAEDRVLGVPRYRFLGQGDLAPDHLDLVAARGCERLVAESFTAWLQRPGARLLHLDGVDQTALVRSAVAGRWQPIESAPYAPLPTDGSAFLAGLSASFRRTVRRSARRLTAAGHVHRRVPTTDAPAAMAAFWRLHRERGDRERLLSQRAAVDTAVQAGLARDECRIDVLDGVAGPIAVAVSFVVAGRLSLYQVSRSLRREHAGAGTVLLVELIEDAAAAGCQEVDLLRGDEAYKQHFAREVRPMLALRAAYGGRAQALARGQQVARAARRRWSSARA